MAKHRPGLLERAKRRAERRLRKLEAEIASIKEIFPHLRFGSAVSPSMPDAVEERTTNRRRQRTVAAQRKTTTAGARARATTRRQTKRGKTKA
jgi:hypothetical protein